MHKSDKSKPTSSKKINYKMQIRKTDVIWNYWQMTEEGSPEYYLWDFSKFFMQTKNEEGKLNW